MPFMILHVIHDILKPHAIAMQYYSFELIIIILLIFVELIFARIFLYIFSPNIGLID